VSLISIIASLQTESVLLLYQKFKRSAKFSLIPSHSKLMYGLFLTACTHCLC